jgi:hypothetical protein
MAWICTFACNQLRSKCISLTDGIFSFFLQLLCSFNCGLRNDWVPKKLNKMEQISNFASRSPLCWVIFVHAFDWKIKLIWSNVSCEFTGNRVLQSIIKLLDWWSRFYDFTHIYIVQSNQQVEMSLFIRRYFNNSGVRSFSSVKKFASLEPKSISKTNPHAVPNLGNPCRISFPFLQLVFIRSQWRLENVKFPYFHSRSFEWR